MALRVTYRRRKSYNTKSNKIRKVKTPGGRLVVQYVQKRAKGPQLQLDSKSKVGGVSKLRNPQFSQLSYTQRSISRPYGGQFSPSELKDRIKRAFLIEEMKISKKISKQSTK